MKFIDEAYIRVDAGKGGPGCLSFRREKYVAKGGPNGGDGGDGGSVIFHATKSLNTLVDFRFVRIYKAENGHSGQGKEKTGRAGNDLIINVPCGTRVLDAKTKEVLADLIDDGQKQVIAQGGFHGLGNTRFKSSVNRAPRETTPGSLGESIEIKLELNVLADVGLLGLPNAGKSTLISSLSSARPKIADYPFTTLYPNLGVVRLGIEQSYVMADIPGLIEGAADGAGLGHRFLKHLQRTRVLLHLIDITTSELQPSDIVRDVKAILSELAKYDEVLMDKPRFLVLNKIDTVEDLSYLDEIEFQLRSELNWTGPIYRISAVSRIGLDKLSYDLLQAVTEFDRIEY